MCGDETKTPDKIQAFDTLFTTNHIQILKILLPSCQPSFQKQLVLYIKFLELQYTLQFFKVHPFAYPPENAPVDPSVLLGEMLPYCAPSEKEHIRKLQEVMDTAKNAQEMMETVNMMKDVFPDGAPFGGEGMDFDMSQILQMFQG